MTNKLVMKDLIKDFAEENDMSPKEVKEALDIAKAFICDTLVDMDVDDAFTLSGLGTFKKSERKARKGVNPRNPEEEIDIPASNVVKFSISKSLKEDIQ